MVDKKYKFLQIKDGTLRKISGTKMWEVASDYTFTILDSKVGTFKIIIKSGFRTDFGSIPSLFQVLFDPTKYISYILHDFLYTYKQVDGEFMPISISRKESDSLLLSGLMFEGASNFEFLLIFYAVRLFGDGHY